MRKMNKTIVTIAQLFTIGAPSCGEKRYEWH